jgi:hypothetical protein
MEEVAAGRGKIPKSVFVERMYSRCELGRVQRVWDDVGTFGFELCACVYPAAEKHLQDLASVAYPPGWSWGCLIARQSYSSSAQCDGNNFRDGGVVPYK